MSQPGTGYLDAIGRWLLNTIDYRVWGLASIAVILGLAILRRRRFGTWPELTDWVRAATGSLGIYTGFTVGCVFLLTKPPYLEALTDDSFGLIAFVTTIVCIGLGLREMLTVAAPVVRMPPRQLADPAPSKASGQSPPSSPESS